MKLYDNWREILRHAWSIKFIIVAGVLSGCEFALPLISDQFSPGVFAALSGFFCGAALISRLVAQRGV